MNQNEQVDREILFAIEYVKDFNGTRAAERVGYQQDDSVLAVTASRLLRKAKIQNKIRELLTANVMSAEEVLWRFAQEARLSISDFIIQKNGSFELNWSNIRKYGYLIKSITATRYGPKIELHDAQKARELIGKHFGLFTDKIEVSWREQTPDGYNADEVQKQFAELMAIAQQAHKE
jgi:phage terminase small subunit